METISLAGTVLELETIDSNVAAELKTGGAISLRITGSVIVEGVELIAAGTVAVGVVTTIEKCECCDRPQQLLLNLDNVRTSDGSLISLAVKLARSEKPEKEMAAAALMFPAASLAVALFAKQHRARAGLEKRFRVVCI